MHIIKHDCCYADTLSKIHNLKNVGFSAFTVPQHTLICPTHTLLFPSHTHYSLYSTLFPSILALSPYLIILGVLPSGTDSYPKASLGRGFCCELHMLHWLYYIMPGSEQEKLIQDRDSIGSLCVYTWVCICVVLYVLIMVCVWMCLHICLFARISLTR